MTTALVMMWACAPATEDVVAATVGSNGHDLVEDAERTTPHDGRTLLAVQSYIEGVGGPLPTEPLRVYLDHVYVGDTDASGYVELEVEPGTHFVRLVQSGIHGGWVEDAVALEGERVFLETGLRSQMLAEPRTENTVPELIDGWVLPADTPSITWHIEDGMGHPVALVENVVDHGLSLHTPIGGPGSTRQLNLQGASPSKLDVDGDGHLFVTDMDAVQTWLAERGDVVVAVDMHASSGDDLFYRHRVEFRVGHHTWSGVIHPPPGDPGLDLEGMTVRAELFSEQRVTGAFETTVDADGAFRFDDLPTGPWALLGSLVAPDGTAYRVRDAPRLQSDLDRTYQLLSSPDIEAGLTYRLDQP